MISARNASLLSASVATGTVLATAIYASLRQEVITESGVGIAIVRQLAVALLLFGLVVACVRLGLRMSRSTETRLWVAIATPLVSTAILMFLPPIPLERLGQSAFNMFAISHPTVLASTIIHIAALAQMACVLIAVSFTFGYLSRRFSVRANKSLDRTREG